MIVLIFACLAISFLFSGLEAGLLSVNLVRLQHLARQGDSTALKLQRLLAQPDRILATVLLVTNGMNITAVALSAWLLVARFGTAGFGIALLLFLPVVAVLVEVLPKSMFRRFPYRLLSLLAPLLEVAHLLLSPLVSLGGGLQKLLLRNPAAQGRKLLIAREHFKFLTAESERDGTLTSVERRMIHNVVDFRSVAVSAIMLPVERIVSIGPDVETEAALRLAGEHQIERLPVLAADGTPLGLVVTFEILLDPARAPLITSYIRRIVQASPEEQAYTVLRKLRAARLGMAVVVDAAGRTVGMVTEEEIVAHLVNSAISPTPEKPPLSSGNNSL